MNSIFKRWMLKLLAHLNWLSMEKHKRNCLYTSTKWQGLSDATNTLWYQSLSTHALFCAQQLPLNKGRMDHLVLVVAVFVTYSACVKLCFLLSLSPSVCFGWTWDSWGRLPCLSPAVPDGLWINVLAPSPGLSLAPSPVLILHCWFYIFIL